MMESVKNDTFALMPLAQVLSLRISPFFISLFLFTAIVGKVWVPKEPEKTREEDEPRVMLDLDDESAQALDGASEADLVDLAGILGLHSMLNQDQYHASILNKGQKTGLDRFESVVKATQPKPVPFEPPNPTDPVQTAEQVCNNDPNLTQLNWNNIKVCLAQKSNNPLAHPTTDN